MIDLDGPRWAELGSPGLVDPRRVRETVRHLVRVVRAGERGSEPWRALCDLFHQSSYEPATLAALPHLVALGETHEVARAGALFLAGMIEVTGRIDARKIPADVLDDHRQARTVVRAWSWRVLERFAPTWQVERPYLVQAFAGLRHRAALVVDLCDDVDPEHGVEGWRDCACGRRVHVAVEPISTGGWLRRVTCGAEGAEDLLDEDASSALVRAARARGEAFLGRDDPDWPLAATPDVLVAVAERVGWRAGAESFAALSRPTACPGCGAALDLARVEHDHAWRVPL